MKALFATRCGAQQTFQVSWPPPPEIHLPLGPSKRWGVNSFDAEVSFLPLPTPGDPLQIRRFFLTERPRTPSDTAYYAEGI